MLKAIGRALVALAKVIAAVLMWDFFLTEQLIQASGAKKEADEFHEFNKYAWALVFPVLIVIGACIGVLIYLLPKV